MSEITSPTQLVFSRPLGCHGMISICHLRDQWYWTLSNTLWKGGMRYARGNINRMRVFEAVSICKFQVDDVIIAVIHYWLFLTTSMSPLMKLSPGIRIVKDGLSTGSSSGNVSNWNTVIQWRHRIPACL